MTRPFRPRLEGEIVIVRPAAWRLAALARGFIQRLKVHFGRLEATLRVR